MKPKAKSLMRISGGNPNGFPDFVPLNPWGRGFPKELLNRPPRPQLYQLIVRDKRDGNKELRVGPKMEKQYVELMHGALVREIVSGAETRWFDPIVVPMPAEL